MDYILCDLWVSRGKNGLIWFMLFFLPALVSLMLPAPALHASSYRFERMWPSLQQPWYFSWPSGMAVDKGGNIYIVDQRQFCIQKYTPDGRFISKWGSRGSGNGRFEGAWGIAVNLAGIVYVADTGNNRIQRFSADGRFLGQWGTEGGGNGQFRQPSGVAVDPYGYIYVLDAGNNRVQKFTAGGAFVECWGKQGDGPGEFNLSCPGNGLTWYPNLAIGSNGYIYIADIGNNRVQKLTPDGVCVKMWGDDLFQNPCNVAIDRAGNVMVVDLENFRVWKFTSNGEFPRVFCGSWGLGDGQFNFPYGIAIDKPGHVYVTDFFSGRIHKFSSTGDFLAKWSSKGTNPGFFFYAMGLAWDRAGNILVTDYDNNRIQKFSKDGKFLSKWGSFGLGNGQFQRPWGIGTDSKGYIYVADSENYRIQKFSASGAFILAWDIGEEPRPNGVGPAGLAVDASDYIYITAYHDGHVKKFTTNGALVAEWGTYGVGDGEFQYPSGIAIGKSGNVYVLDNTRVQKFTKDGKLITSWEGAGSPGGAFAYPCGLTTDDQENVLVADTYNHQIQRFSSTGAYLGKISSRGSQPGLMLSPGGVLADALGNIYVAEIGNSRIQFFRKTTATSRNKAIILAGGGPFPGNSLWDATQMNANFAYRTLTYQGFTENRIYYLSANKNVDADGSGGPVVRAVPTNAHLRYAITQWAAGADNVLLYLTDHGSAGQFRLSENQYLKATNLNTWIAALEKTITGKVVIVYDACESGSFLPVLKDAGRVIIASTSADEYAHFINHGSISFSNYFFTQIFNGLDLASSFKAAKAALGFTVTKQHPLLDSNGNGVPNEAADEQIASALHIMNRTSTFETAPKIGAVSPAQTITGKSSASVHAYRVSGTSPIARVWAVVRPPSYSPGSGPIEELPSFELKRVKGTTRYAGTYTELNQEGTYMIAVYAMDRFGNSSRPAFTTVSIRSPLLRKAIIVVGGDQSDPQWPAYEANAANAYRILKSQGYTAKARENVKKTILYMSAGGTEGVDFAPSLRNLKWAIETWAGGETRDLVLYLVGSGGAGTFKLTATQTLESKDLGTWLDNFQVSTGATAILIYDANRSGSFMADLAPPSGKKRISIASARSTQPAGFIPQGGDVSFSGYFWRQIGNGANVRDAFLYAKDNVGVALCRQSPAMDDDGNGIADEKTDGILSRSTSIGFGIMVGADPPSIAAVSPPLTLSGQTSADIQATGIVPSRGIKRVFAIIVPPRFDPSADSRLQLPRVALRNMGGGIYQGSYDRFTRLGTYKIYVYAMDSQGEISRPRKTTVRQTAGEWLPATGPEEGIELSN